MEIRHHHMFACVDPDDNSIFFGCNVFKFYEPRLHSATVMVPKHGVYSWEKRSGREKKRETFIFFLKGKEKVGVSEGVFPDYQGRVGRGRGGSI